MSNTSITKLLLVEDNPGDARLLREMLNEEDTLNTELTHVRVHERCRAPSGSSTRPTSSCSTWVCPMRKDWKRSGGRAPPRPASPWWC